MADSKPWFKSQTILSDIATAVVGIYAVLQPILALHGVNLPAADSKIIGTILAVLAGLGINGRVNASSKIG